MTPKPTTKKRKGNLYVDNFGVVWKLFYKYHWTGNFPVLWNKRLGEGCWDNGNGLKLLRENKENE